MSRLARISSRVFNVSDKTNWCFVAAESDDGTVGWGEASLNGREPQLEHEIEACARPWRGRPIAEVQVGLAVDAASPRGLPFNAAVSAVQQALLALAAARDGRPLHVALGTLARREVPAYANINRATALRTPAGFVATARRAQAEGYAGVKAAPFDGVTPANAASAEGRRLVRHGIDCMLGLRDALGPDMRLMVDCHWRFDEATALDTLRALAPARLHWFECPLPETPAHWPALRRIRAAVREQGVLLAAAETQVGMAAFQRLFDEGLYDVVMPDVKYCGGPREMLAIAARAADAGVRFSPHNPTGPLCSQHSLHVAAVAPACEWLEMQYDESPLYGELVGHAQPRLVHGGLPVPMTAGLGLVPDDAVLASHPYRAVPLGLEAQAA